MQSKKLCNFAIILSNNTIKYNNLKIKSNTNEKYNTNEKIV